MERSLKRYEMIGEKYAIAEGSIGSDNPNLPPIRVLTMKFTGVLVANQAAAEFIVALGSEDALAFAGYVDQYAKTIPSPKEQLTPKETNDSV